MTDLVVNSGAKVSAVGQSGGSIRLAGNRRLVVENDAIIDTTSLRGGGRITLSCDQGAIALTGQVLASALATDDRPADGGGISFLSNSSMKLTVGGDGRACVDSKNGDGGVISIRSSSGDVTVEVIGELSAKTDKELSRSDGSLYIVADGKIVTNIDKKGKVTAAINSRGTASAESRSKSLAILTAGPGVVIGSVYAQDSIEILGGLSC